MKIGTEELSIQSESKKSVDLEIMFLNTLVYIVVFLYAFDYLNWVVFYLLFHLFYMRFFVGNHDRFHTDSNRRWPRPIELFAENFALVVTPWDEPYDSVRKKHFIHHATHIPNRIPNDVILLDPHSIYEVGGFWLSLFYCTFFEEAQLIIDIRNKHITRSRWVRLAIYLPLQILFFITFGWETYLGIFIAVRLMSASSWLSFSWYTHTSLYQFGLAKQVTTPVLFLLGLINGKRVKDGYYRHAAHHAWPQIPSNKLYIIDDAVMRNPNAMPGMITTS